MDTRWDAASRDPDCLVSKEERRLHLSRAARKAIKRRGNEDIEYNKRRCKAGEGVRGGRVSRGSLFNRVGENEKPAVHPESGGVIAADKKCQRNTTVPRKLTATMTEGCAQPLFHRFVWPSLDLPRVFLTSRCAMPQQRGRPGRKGEKGNLKALGAPRARRARPELEFRKILKWNSR